VIAWSTFNAPVPANSRFGRADDPKLEVLCTNPAALGGGSGRLTPIYPTTPFAPGVIGSLTKVAVGNLPQPSTPWVSSPGAYTARCSSADAAHVLQVTAAPGAPTLTPQPDPGWGLHLADANVALGNLADLVRREIRAYAARAR
jgi:hypothetical protein